MVLAANGMASRNSHRAIIENSSKDPLPSADNISMSRASERKTKMENVTTKHEFYSQGWPQDVLRRVERKAAKLTERGFPTVGYIKHVDNGSGVDMAQGFIKEATPGSWDSE